MFPLTCTHTHAHTHAETHCGLLPLWQTESYFACVHLWQLLAYSSKSTDMFFWFLFFFSFSLSQKQWECTVKTSTDSIAYIYMNILHPPKMDYLQVLLKLSGWCAWCLPMLLCRCWLACKGINDTENVMWKQFLNNNKVPMYMDIPKNWSPQTQGEKNTKTETNSYTVLYTPQQIISS